jgi:hypothetical protein
VKDSEHKRLSAKDVLESHTYICDLINVEFPVLSLYSDGRENWLYLWNDTDTRGMDRWFLFKVSRDNLTAYLKGKKSLRSVVDAAPRLLKLEQRAGEWEQPSSAREPRRPRRRLHQIDADFYADQLPDEDSLFDPSMTEDLDLSKDVVPHIYKVPIDGAWFERDFEFLFKRYRRLYSFFYATRPQFVRTVSQKLYRCLRAPWKGGFSRLNLYSYLAQEIPAQHALRVSGIQYASPGYVGFEALPGIGESIQLAVLAYLANEAEVSQASNTISNTLKRTGLATRDVSEFSDEMLGVYDKSLGELRESCSLIGERLRAVNEVRALCEASPNTVIYSKAVNSFVRQVYMLSKLQRDDMLDFSRPIPSAAKKKRRRAHK